LGTPLYEVCERLIPMMGEGATGGVPDGSLSTTAFDCAALGIRADDFYDDYYGRFRSGPLRGTSFTVTGFDQEATVGNTTTRGKVTFTPPASVAVTAADIFYLSVEFRPEELVSAVNLAIAMVSQKALSDITSDTLTVATDASGNTLYEYTVPSGIDYIEQVYMESADAGRYSHSGNRIDERHWRIRRGPTPRLWFDDDLVSLTADRHLRIVGQRYAQELSADSDETTIDPGWLVFQAKALLHQSRIRGSGADFEEHETQMRLSQAMADSRRYLVEVMPRGVRVAF